MDRIRNPYAPGAGTPPPELVGRDEIREDVRVALERVRIGRSSKNVVMVGLRGVGKTVLLDRMREDAEKSGFYTLQIEAPENRSLPAIIAPQLSAVLLQLSTRQKSKQLAEKALRVLAGFINAVKVKYHDVEISLNVEPEFGLADTGDLEYDLRELFASVGNAAQADRNCVAIFLDELQYVKEPELAALISTFHFIAQRKLPIVMVGAGLPQVRGQLGRAKSYAERMFDFPQIGALSHQDAKTAIAKPASDEGVEFEPAAIGKLIDESECYPYFLQSWGKYVWNVADSSPITVEAVELASDLAVADLDVNFFLVRFDRLTQWEKRYLRAMAQLGKGPHRSGDVAQQLRRGVTSVGKIRSNLIAKGMIWSPSHGDTAFTVPMFDQFMIRIMPELPE